MRRIYQITLYLDTDLIGTPPDHRDVAERLARAIMAALPHELVADATYAVRLRSADATYRGHAVPRVQPQDAARTNIASRRLLPG